MRPLYRGFRTDNFQARVNSLTPGLDGWLWGASGLAPGEIESLGGGARVDVRGRDFRIQPLTGELEPVSGITQQGRCRDDFGAWFGCDNSTLLRHYPLDDRYLRRNPHFTPPRTEVFVPRGEDPSRLHPIAPILDRYNDLMMAGRATSACGITIYRDDLLGPAYAGNSFTAETVHNLVTRLQLSEEGVSFAGHRAPEEQTSEFLASSDPWFRPVQARTGPDGALYVVDMCRFVIEHPTWIPAERLAQLDVRAGAGLGRIWKVAPADRPLRVVPRLERLDGPGLVAAMDSPNGTLRDLAQHAIVRKHFSPLSELRALARESQLPAVRVQALATLEELGALTPDDLRPALAQPHAGLRIQAMRMSEAFLDLDAELLETVAELARDPHARVRLQAACSLGESRSPRAAQALADRFFAEDSDEYVRAGLLSSVLPHLEPLLARALSRSASGGRTIERAESLLQLAAQSDHRSALAAATQGIAALREAGDFADPLRLAAALLKAADARGAAVLLTALPGGERLAFACAEARRQLANAGGDPEHRASLLMLLGRQSEHRERDHARLGALLGGVEAASVQRAALAAIERLADPVGSATILAAWERSGPALRPALLDALLARESWTSALLEALPTRPEIRAALDAARRARLLEHANASLRQRAHEILEVPADADRDALLARFASARQLAGDRARGEAAFVASCSLCHSLDGVGFAVGPDLAALSDRSVGALLTAILDPDRAINPEYVQYIVWLKDGRSLTGLIRDETPAGFRLLSLAGIETVLLRESVAEVVDTRASMMPKGFENQLSPSDIADLAVYLQSLGDPPKSFPGNQPQRVKLMVDGALNLTASNARIHGASLVFEAPFQNLGFWSSADDRAVWEIETAVEADWSVRLEYACDPYAAGNRYLLRSELGQIVGEVKSTGAWSSYRTQYSGRLRIPTGLSRLTLEAEGEIRHALMDLRSVQLFPYDPSLPDELESGAAHDLRKLLRGWTAGDPEEYERIPALWQVAIGVGRANRDQELTQLLELALPAKDEELRHWQAVVLGGGLINGLSQNGVWPGERLRALCASEEGLSARLTHAIQSSLAMARDESVPIGTRYDALRMLGIGDWEQHAQQLLPFLERGMDPELQMGAVSGLGDCVDSRAREDLRLRLHHLGPEDRERAESALRRLPTLEQALDSRFDLWADAAIHQPNGPNYDFFAGLLPPLRYVNTAFRHYPIVLSAPNAAIKARFISNGSGVNLHAVTETWRDEGLVPVEFLLRDPDGTLVTFGSDPQRLQGPLLAEGWLPIVELSYECVGGTVEQESFAGLDASDAFVFTRFRSAAARQIRARFGGDAALVHEPGVLRQSDGRILARHDTIFHYESGSRSLVADLPEGGTAHLALPTRGIQQSSAALTPERWSVERARVVAYWHGVIALSAQIHTGEKRVDDAWRALIVGSLSLVQGDVLHYGHGNLYETTFEAECGDAVRALIALGVPEARRLVTPLLQRPYQPGLALNDLAFKLQLFGWCHVMLRDEEWSRAQLAILLPEAERALDWIEADTGLVPAQAYCGDIQTLCHNLYANAAFWRGLRDLALAMRELGRVEERATAERFANSAETLQMNILRAVRMSERLNSDPTFVPIALFGAEQPYTRLTDTLQGSYWNLVAPFVYDSGVFGPDSPRERAMLDYQLERGGTVMGMLRFDQHSGLFANEAGLDDLYTLRHAEALLRRGDAERVLAGFYGKLAQGMTRDTYIGGEGSGLRPLDEHGRPSYLPPNVAANAYFLHVLRQMLVYEVDADRDGRSDGLELTAATSRSWLADGGRIRVERLPTSFGEVSLEIVSELAQKRVRVRVDLPPGLTAPVWLNLRLPEHYTLLDWGSRLQLPFGGGRIEFDAAVTPNSR